MTTLSTPRARLLCFFGKLLCMSLIVGASGLASLPAHASVSVAQSPLTVQQSVPPNIMLMLDDSGSMAWNFMPDICYISGVTCSTYSDGSYKSVTSSNNNLLINPLDNGLYYDPTITYTPPLKADGTYYSNASGLTSAWVDGFASTKTSVDLTNYSGSYEAYFAYGGLYTGASQVTMSTSATKSTTSTNTATYTNVSSSTCKSYYKNTSGATNESYSSSTRTCVITYTTTTSTTYHYFQYAVGSSSTVHYVANTDCGGQSNCVLASDTSGTAAPAGVTAGQNVANWFSYYHTRILMAKSGLMNSFANVGSSFRVGFGSINGNNASGLPSSTATYNSKTIAQVAPFGDGSTGTQKANFWSWLAGESASGGTPLRLSLDAIGQYYQGDQPWSTMSTDPDPNSSTELACRQAYTILTTDGFWNGSTPNGIGNVDGQNGTKITGPDNQSYTYTAAPPYSDTNSDTLADVAMKYWSTDLRTSTSNEVPTSQDDPAFWQHMTTFTLGLGFTPSGISPSGTTVDQIFAWANGGAAISNFSWPTPASDSIYNIADLAHAAVNGHGGFYSATSPEAFASGLSSALAKAASRNGTGASLAANSTSLDVGTVAYQAIYTTSTWTGELKAYSVDSSTGAIATNSNWMATTKMPAAASRTIYTYNPSAKSSAQFTTFSSPTTLSTAEQSALGSTSTVQQTMINYLRGDSSNEESNKGTYRSRTTPLGDIVDSQPVYAGAPDSNQFYGETFTGSDSFATYASDNAATSRTPTVYVAANDGMLHGFNASTGVETFAYLPGAVIKDGGITALANPGYGSTVSHEFFNDGELTVADAYFSKAWHTVLVGTTGRGTSKAVYALDITNPGSISLLWERSALDGQTNSDYIGQMTGKPVIAQTADGTWSVLMGNGYNSTKNVAALLQFDLSTGTLSVHTTSDATTNNGLAAPGVWMASASNGISTEAYAGDLNGKVWSFELNDGTNATDTSTGTLVFTAKDSSGNVQPITAGILVGEDPDTSNVWIFFGTGKYLSSTDLTDTSTQTWYGLIAQSTTSSLVSNLSNGRSALAQRSILAETSGDTTVSPPVLPSRVITPTPTTSDMTDKSGWYLDLISPTTDGTGAKGERIVTPNQFQGNLLLATTRIPEASDLCNPSGTGWIMAVNPFTGTNPSSPFFDTNGDSSINSSDETTYNGTAYASAGVGFTSLPNSPIFVGGSMLVSFDNGSTSNINTSSSTGTTQRVSWRELITQ